jgi:hypothetical protein
MKSQLTNRIEIQDTLSPELHKLEEIKKALFGNYDSSSQEDGEFFIHSGDKDELRYYYTCKVTKQEYQAFRALNHAILELMKYTIEVQEKMRSIKID